MHSIAVSCGKGSLISKVVIQIMDKVKDAALREGFRRNGIWQEREYNVSDGLKVTL